MRSLLPSNVEVRSGPGCPVCVTSPDEIDAAAQLSLRNNVIVTTFGDMFRVPSAIGSLADVKARGGHVKVVYSIHDAVEMARRDPKNEYVHFAIGFETTAPSTAAELLMKPPENFSIICSHRLIPPALEHLLKLGEIKIAGFICPGHVSTIIGARPYRPLSKKYCIPQVIAGFEPIDVLIAITMLLKQIRSGRATVENEYTRSVRERGNVKAQKMMKEVFTIRDADWRGIGKIPFSGFELRSKFENFNAIKRFDVRIEEKYKPPLGCRCGEVLRGLIYPQDCQLFNKVCTPNKPIGPCAVSREGACYIAMRYIEHKL
ncbi:hydrogenase formation protein HypD [Candidatus Bathyarchaeota archaeon]|nr:hydrogenase formation protein HypD [Candidatus Bathyarchaeota archaeon]